jgi:hypothetical protein
MIPKKYPEAGGHSGAVESGNRNTSISRRIHSNARKSQPNPIAFFERYLLCRMMIQGQPIKYKYPFLDSRHEIIYHTLEYLQEQVYYPDTELLIWHLAEYNLIGRAGGEDYLREIFRGAYPSEGRYYGR